MPTAKITLNITQFNALPGACVISQPVIDPGGGGNRVRLADPNEPNTLGIIVRGKGNAPLDLKFTIPGCTPGNVAFAAVGAGPSGSADFTTQVISGSTVTVTDVFAHVGKGASRPKWKYSIPVTNAAGVQGEIDPQIENEDAT